VARVAHAWLQLERGHDGALWRGMWCTRQACPQVRRENLARSIINSRYWLGASSDGFPLSFRAWKDRHGNTEIDYRSKRNRNRFKPLK
jgi:hypothetical protein